LQPALERRQVHAGRGAGRGLRGADGRRRRGRGPRHRARHRPGRPGADLRGVPAGGPGQRRDGPRAAALAPVRRAPRGAALGRDRGGRGHHVPLHAAGRPARTDLMPEELVLIVDDNDKNLRLARDVLRFAGFRTLEASTAVDGLALAAEQRPDVILMDIRLPDMDGTAAARQLKDDDRTAGIPLVALTSFAMKGDREWFLAAGFDGYL